MKHSNAAFGWLEVARLGLVQACIGAVIVVITSVLNRIMVVELALPALLPGLLVTWHYVVQLVRPRMGFGADQAQRCTPWIFGGMLVLALGGWLATFAVTQLPSNFGFGLALGILAFSIIGLGVSACATSVLALLAKRVPDGRRAPAATLVWLMMIFGLAMTASIMGKLIDPYSPQRLLRVVTGLALLVVGATALSLWRLEGPASTKAPDALAPTAKETPTAKKFRAALAQLWREPQARIFTVFVFLSMLAYNTQDLILEPFAAVVFGLTVGQTTQLSGLQHRGVLLGMLWTALVGAELIKGRLGSVQGWMVSGCALSGLAMAGLALAGVFGASWPLQTNIVLLGVANGIFSIAAIATMMRLSTQGQAGNEGTRMGVWGAAQALAFGLGGLLGTAASDLAHGLLASSSLAYAAVFSLEALMFAVATGCAIAVNRHTHQPAN